MKIHAIIKNQECSFCRKQKDKLYDIELEQGRRKKLCLKDMEKMLDMLFEEEPNRVDGQKRS